MIIAETIQFTPEQERALFLALFLFLAVCVLLVVGFVLSVVAGARAGADPSRRVARTYWWCWVVFEGVLAIFAVSSGEPLWIGIVATMLSATVGSRRLAARTRRRDGVTPDQKIPEASRPASRDRGAPGSRP